MTTALGAIITSTFRETIRNRALYWILAFGAGLIALSVSMGEWSVFSRWQVMADFGLALLSVAGLLLALFIGVGLLGKEMQERTVYLIAVRPLGRWMLIAGKFAGMMLALLVSYAILCGVFVALVSALAPGQLSSLVPAVLLIVAELAVVVAAAMFFSVVTTQMLASVLTLGFWIAGQYNDLIELQFIEGQQPVFALAMRVIYRLFPNLSLFNVRSLVIYGEGVGVEYTALALCYGLLYTIVLLGAAWFALEKRDL